MRCVLVVLALTPIAVSAPPPLWGQAVLTDGGFGSVPWFSDEEQIRSVWGAPAKSESVVATGYNLLLYPRITRRDSGLAVIAFGIHPNRGLLVGSVLEVYSDSTAAFASASELTRLLTSIRGNPLCDRYHTDPGWLVDHSRRWKLGSRSPRDCGRWDLELRRAYQSDPEVGLVVLHALAPVTHTSHLREDVSFYGPVLTLHANELVRSLDRESVVTLLEYVSE